MTPTSEQWKSALRAIIMAAAAAALGWVSHAGYITTEQIHDIMSWPLLPLVVAMVASALWGWINKTAPNMVAVVQDLAPEELAKAMAKVKPVQMVEAVNALPTVAGVVTTNDPAGVALANAIPSTTVAPATSQNAVDVATATVIAVPKP